MHLKEGELFNFRQHASLAVPVQGHLIGLVGPNGRGKSNLLGSIQWALTGEVPGVVKENLLRWGEKDGYAMWRFEHGGNDVTVCRGVGEGPTWMRVNDGKKIVGITKVNEALMDLAGIDKDVGRMIFVGQKMLDQVLFDLPSKREQAFQRLCGMGDASKINREVGNFLSVRMNEVPNYDEQIAEAQRQRVEFAQMLETVNQQLGQLGANLPAETREALETAVAGSDVLIQLLSRILDYQAQQVNVQNSLGPLHGQIQQLDAQGADVPLASIDDHITKLDNLIRDAQAYQRAWSDFEKANYDRNLVGEPPHKPEDVQQLKTAYEQLSQAYHESSGRLALYRQLLKALMAPNVDFSECPVCGSKIGDRAFATQHLQSMIQLAEQEAAGATPTQAKLLLDQATHRLSSYEQSKAQAEARVSAADVALKRVVAVPGDVAALIATKQAEVAAIRDIRRDVSQKQLQRSACQGKYDALMQQSQQLMASQIALNTQIEQLLTPMPIRLTEPNEVTLLIQQYQGKRAQAQQGVQAWQKYQIDKANLEGQIKQLQGNQFRIEQTLKDLEYKRGQQNTFRQVIDTLTNVREFFHYTNGPHQLAVSILNEMNRDVNMFLQKLNAPFSVTAHDTGLTYLVQFHDGRPMPATGYMEATELSGGEKVLLAVSFRLASYMMFANKMGLLSLDEPTAYLDDTNIANFCELLDTLKNVARSLDLQLIISTHERATIPFMDSVIDLGTDTGQQNDDSEKEPSTQPGDGK